MDASSKSVTLADIEAEIASEHYFTAAQGVAAAGGPCPPTLELLTFCVLILKNRIKCVGYSAPVDASIFDAEKGRQYARKMAIDDAWPKMGMRLADLKVADASFKRWQEANRNSNAPASDT